MKIQWSKAEMGWNSEGLRNLDRRLGKGDNLRKRNYLMEKLMRGSQ